MKTLLKIFVSIGAIVGVLYLVTVAIVIGFDGTVIELTDHTVTIGNGGFHIQSNPINVEAIR